MISSTERFAQMQFEWQENPVQGIRDLFQAEPTIQQIQLIKAAWNPRARVAVSSCTGAGKTTALTWLTMLFLLTQEDCRILITSPSFQQLNRVFHAEFRKWRGKMDTKIGGMFDVTREKIVCTSNKGVQEANLVTASAENKESLQGGHAKNYVILGDEASAIEEDTFDVLYRTLSTDTGGRLILTSNPTRSVGRFYDIFHKDLKEWDKMFFTAFDCPHIAEGFPEEQEEMYGIDSDHYRIGVLGQFPRTTNSQFISSDVVDKALENNIPHGAYHHYPMIIGADIARFGDDKTVFVARQGPKIVNITQLENQDTMQVAGALHDYQRDHKGVVCYIDAIGIGAGVFDRCKELGMPVREVMGSRKPSKPMEYFNLRSQLWGEMRHWLNNEADLPYMAEIREQLLGMTYGYNNKMQMALTTKKDIKKSGKKSPDIGDAISLTFADTVYGSAGNRTRARKVKPSTYLYA